MFTQEDVNRIALELPAKAMQDIASKAHVSRPTVYRFFQGIKVRQQERIYMAALSVIERDRIRVQRVREKHAKLFSSANQTLPTA